MAPKFRMAGCREAPVFHPSAQEFADPLRYIASIRAEAEPCGLCRIVPPPGWVVPFNQDPGTFTFKTRVQTVNELQLRLAKGKHKTWRVEYVEFMQTHENQTVTRWPVFGGRKLDLRVLYECVVGKHGGFDLACRGKLWRTIAREVDGTDATIADASSLKQLYQKWLLSFETHKKRTAELSPAGKAKEAAATKKEKEEERKREKASAAAAAERAAAMETTSEKEEDLLEALFELGNVAEPPPKRLKLEMGLEEVAQQLESFGCQNCGGSTHEDSMILCDGCDLGYHTYCLAPPLLSIPSGDWFCPDCIASANNVDDLGFNTGKSFTMDEFEQSCAKFDEQFFANHSPDGSGKRPSIPEIEEHFWRMVEEGVGGSSGDTVDVHYGADVDTSVHGSAFPRAWDADHGRNNRSGEKNAAATHAWNLNNIPRHPSRFSKNEKNNPPSTGIDDGMSDLEDETMDDKDDDDNDSTLDHISLLRKVRDHIPGVLVPWLYFGSTFSSFCWHFEDHALYSMNYNHVGAAKTWYGVPGESAEQFEESFKKQLPDLFASQPDLLFQLVTMLSPSLLVKDNVPVYRTDQHAGEFVVTFPRSYHAGFNTGFNVAEAVNFAPADWLRFARFGVERYRSFNKPSVLCHDELLCVAACDDVIGAEAAKWLLSDLKQTLAEERTGREKLVANGVVRSRRYTPKKLLSKTQAAQNKVERQKKQMVASAGGRKGKSPPKAAEKADPKTEDNSLGENVDGALSDKNANGTYDRECTICRYILHLSGVACTCNPDRPACLRHSNELCDCPNSKRVLFYRKSIAQLEGLVKTVERACGGKKQKGGSGLDAKSQAAAKARAKKSSAWVKEAMTALAQKSPPIAAEELDSILIASEEFTWAGEDMDGVREVAHNVSIAIAFQRELTVLKRRIDAVNNENDEDATRLAWSEPVVDDADIVVAAAAGAPVRVRRGGKYVDRETDAEAAARRAAETAAAGAAEAKVNRDVAAAASLEDTPSKKETEDVKDTPTVAPPRRMTLRRLKELLHAAPFSLPDADADTFTQALAAGEDLETRVASALAERPHPNPKKCISLAAETTRGPLEVTSAKRLRETVSLAHAWSERLRKMLPGKRHRVKAELPRAADLEALRKDASKLPVQPNDLASLDAALTETEAWRTKSRALLDAVDADRFTLERAETLLQEGETLPVACDEVDAVADAVAAAKSWDEEAQKADEADAKLDVLKRLFAQVRQTEDGAEVNVQNKPKTEQKDTSTTTDQPPLLLVLPEEVDALQERIRVREWADPAKRVAAGKPTAATLREIRELVKSGAAILEGVIPDVVSDKKLTPDTKPMSPEKQPKRGKKGGKKTAVTAVTQTKEPVPSVAVADDHVKDFERTLLERLRLCVLLGEAWEEKASSLLSDAKKGELHLPALEDVEKLVKESLGISATLQGYDELSEAATEARKWSEKAQSCLRGKQLTRRGAAEKKDATPPTLAHAERLIRDAGKFIVAVKELELLQERVDNAKEWGTQAEEIIERWREDGAEVTFNEIMVDHDRFGLELPAATDVRAFISALEWEREAREALSGSNDNDEDDDRPDLEVLTDLRDRLEQLDSDITEEMEQRLLEEVKTRLEICDEWTQRVDEVLKLAGSVASAEESPTETRTQSKPVSTERAAAEAKAAAEKCPTPDAVSKLVEQGKKLPAVSPKVVELETALEEHEAWVEAARGLLGPPLPAPTAEEVAANEQEASEEASLKEEELREEAKLKSKKKKKGFRNGNVQGVGGKSVADADIEPQTDSKEERSHNARRAKRILAAVAVNLKKRKEEQNVPDTQKTTRPDMNDVLAILKRGESLPLKSTEGVEIAETAAAANAWSDRLRKLLVKPRSSVGVHAVAVEDPGTALKVIAHSIRAAINDLNGTGEPPESEEGQFCLCRQPGGKEMIGCDICGDWYHLRCVSVTAAYARNAKHYTCPACRASAPDGDVFEINKPDVTHRHIHCTRRPSLASLGEALLEAVKFRGKLPEEDLLVEVFTLHDEWRAAVADAKERRAGVAGVEEEAAEARRVYEAAEAQASVPRNARLARKKGVKDRAAAVQQAQVLAGATAMAAALLGAGGGGTAAAAMEATQRCATLPPEQQLDALGQQVAAAAAIKQQQLMQLKGAVAAAAAAGLAGGDNSQESVAAAAESASPFEALLIAQLQDLGTFVHQLATSQQHIQAQLAAAAPADAAAQQYQVVIQVMMLQQHYVALSKQQDVQLETLGSGLLEQQRVVAAAAAVAMEQDEEDVEVKATTAAEVKTKTEATETEPAAEPTDAAENPELETAEVDAKAGNTSDKPEIVTDVTADVTTDEADKPEIKPEETEPEAPPAPAPTKERRKKAPELPSQEELELTAKSVALKKAWDDAAAILLKHTTPSPKRQMLAGLKGALAMEIEHDPAHAELGVLLRETCGGVWKVRAEKAMEGVPDSAFEKVSDNEFVVLPVAASSPTVDKTEEATAVTTYPTLSVLTKLRETGVASGMIVPGDEGGIDSFPSKTLGLKIDALERVGQKWLDRAADAVDKTKDMPVNEVKELLAEGKVLPINLKEELEELGERCEVYCVCQTSYDATRPMISCDACEGWFHYECCDMAPPLLHEPEDESVRFKCPPCCASRGVKYAPFRGPPDHAAMAAAAKRKEEEKLEALKKAQEESEDDDSEEPSSAKAEDVANIQEEAPKQDDGSSPMDTDELKKEELIVEAKKEKAELAAPSGRGTRRSGRR